MCSTLDLQLTPNVPQKPKPKRYGDKQIAKRGWNKSKTKLPTEFSKARNN
jgi:hypothetical protein